jgi:hypothetical protein
MKKRILKPDHIASLRMAVNSYFRKLKDAHWAVVTFSGPVAASHELLKNIQKDRQETEDAMLAVCRAFEDQFKKDA